MGDSSRQVRKSIEVFNLVFGDISDEIPSHQTVLDWVKKCGLALYRKNSRQPALKDINYSIIMDNSITVGGQDLHVELSAPASHPGHALRHSDVDVLKMSVDEKWTKEMVASELSDTVSQVGHRPDYVVTDNGRAMQGGVRHTAIPNHRDISHSFGMYLERVYGKDEEYAELVQKIGCARKYGHTPIAHLMPPKRRAYARFMNVFDSIQWAHDVMQSDFRLPKMAREVFGFVYTHASLIEELQDVMDAFRYMERLCKSRGLSHETARECIACISRTLMLYGERPRRLGELLAGYFRQEESLLENDGAVHNICSDVIESGFGYFKSRMSSCANHGFTSLILLLPLHFRLSEVEGCMNFDVAEYLGGMTLTELNEWKRKSLLPNMSQNRTQTLKIAI